VRLPIKHTARFINGSAFKPSDWGNEGKPIVRIAQLTGGEFDNYFDGEIASRYEIDSGDLLFSWSATLDSFEWQRGPALLNQHIFKVIPFAGTNQRFLFYSLKHHSSVWADLDAHGSTMRHIKKESLSNKIWLPDLATQKNIADFLDRETARIDQLIEKKRRQLDLFSEKEKGEISRLVLRGSDARADTSPSGIAWRGDVPKHWIESRLKAHFKMRKRQGFEDQPVLSVYREFGVIEKSSRDDNINKTPEDLSKYQLVEPGDLVVNKMKSWQGSLGISEFLGITSPDYVVMVPIGEHDSGYMHHLLRARPMPTVYHLISNGVRIDQWRMEPEKFLSLPIFLPPLHEQRQIAASVNRILNSLRNVAEAVGRSIDRLREHRAALITAAVTGQIDIRENLSTVAFTSDRDRFRLVVGAEIVHQHRSNPKFGRVKLQKELYLAEAHLGIGELRGNYFRQAAGPLDRALIEETERAVEAAGYYKAKQADGAGSTVTYTPLSNAGRHDAELKSLLGPRADALGGLIALLRDFGTEAVEAIATLYAVWNDALIDGQHPDDSKIVNGVLTEWHEEKGKKFNDSNLRHWLDWMKRNGLTPRGQGPRTTHTMTRDMFA